MHDWLEVNFCSPPWGSLRRWREEAQWTWWRGSVPSREWSQRWIRQQTEPWTGRTDPVCLRSPPGSCWRHCSERKRCFVCSLDFLLRPTRLLDEECHFSGWENRLVVTFSTASFQGFQQRHNGSLRLPVRNCPVFVCSNEKRKQSVWTRTRASVRMSRNWSSYSESLLFSSPDSCKSNQPISCFRIDVNSRVLIRCPCL